MKRKLLLLLWLGFWLMPSAALAQNLAAQQVQTLQSAATATGNGTALDVRTASAISAQVTGTFVGTVTWEGTVDGTNWIALQATNANDDTRATTATAPGIYSVVLNGAVNFRARISAYTSGSITVKARLGQGMITRNAGGGGGGGGSWGSITGTLSNQTDLQTALDGKQSAFGSQTANRVYAGPTTGSPASATFRALVAADIPDLSATYQPLNGNLTTIGGLTPSNDDILQRKAGAWVNRTVAQYKTDLGLATIATSGSASDLGAGTVPLARLSGITSTQLDAAAGITSAQLAGSIANAKLANSSVTVAGTSVSLGGSITGSAILDSIGSTQGQILYRGASGWAVLAPGTAGQHLQTGGAAANPSWVNAVSGANPTASVGLSAVNGVATTFMRSDGAPALDQSITPTWTGQHIWQVSNAAAVSIGPNGNTNPTLRVVTNVASAATGLSITGNAAGSGVTLTALSSGSNENITITPKGTGFTLTNFIATANTQSWGLYASGSGSALAGLNLGNTASIRWSTDGTYFGATQAILRSAAANNFALGSTDQAAPPAQTISVTNVVAGTSNTAGADWTHDNSRGTGTGAGGNFIIRTAPAGTSGTSQNALAESFRVNNYGGIRPSSVTFANLPGSPTNGDQIYCSDCAPTSAFVNQTCTSGGSGSMAFRVNGAWKCYN